MTLIDSEGRRSNVVRYGDYSTLLASDGTILMVMRNNTLSTLFRADDSKVVINHNSSTSSCSTKDRVHVIRHVYAAVCELSYTWPIDILLHQNWLMKTQPIEKQNKINIGDIQNLMSNKEGSMTLDDLFNAQE